MDGPFDVLVVGAGCAGMRAAIEAHDAGARVAVVSKLHPTRSHSGAAEGGINAALGNKADDDPETHAFDTVKGSDYLGDQDAIEIFTRKAPGDIYQLEGWGWSLAERGGQARPAPVRCGGLAANRLLRRHHGPRPHPGPVRAAAEAHGPRPRRIRGVLRRPARRGGRPLHGRRLLGPAPRRREGRHRLGDDPRHRRRRAAVPRDHERLRLHRRRDGDGASCGLPLKDMEFMQFHPTTMYPSGILITEGCRGEGGYLINKDGERFMKRYAPNALELASRDVVSRSETTEIEGGRGINGSVMLDLRHLESEKILNKLPGSRELAMTYAGVDPIFAPIPVRPGAHYHMGGVETDEWGLTALEGLYAAGEVACVSVHGANRLGGNSLMETITFGRRAGRHAAEYAVGRAGATNGHVEDARSDAEPG